MKQEFTISIGKIFVERNVLFIRRLDLNSHRKFMDWLLPLAFIAWAILKWSDIENSFDRFGAFVVSVLAVFNIMPLYDVLFRRCWLNRIPISRIKSFEIKDGESSLEKHIILHLHSGRYKKIAFRILEKQYEPFIELISQHSIVQLQKA
jgi:hypothetical protein